MPLLSYRGDLDETMLARTAIKQHGEEEEKERSEIVRKVDQDKAARVKIADNNSFLKGFQYL